MGEGPGWAPFKPSVDRACALQACRVFNATKGNVVADLGEERPLLPLVLQGPVLRCPWNTMFCPLSANSHLPPPPPPPCCPVLMRVPRVWVAHIQVPAPGPVIAQKPQRGARRLCLETRAGLCGLPDSLCCLVPGLNSKSSHVS